MSTAEVMDAVAQFEKLSIEIVNNFEVLSPDNVTDAYAVLEKVRKRLALVDAAYLVAMGSRIPSAEHRKVAWLAQEFRISRAEARQRVQVVERLRKDREPFAPSTADQRMPVLRAKVEDGVIGADAVQKIDKAVRELPASEHSAISKTLDEHVASLVEKIRVDDLAQLPVRLKGMLGIDDPYTDADRARKRSLKISGQGPDGMSVLSGVVTPGLAAVLKRLQADYACPGGLLGDSADDDRSPAQRFHDALEAALHAGFCPKGELKPARGTTTLVTVAHIADIAALAGVSLNPGVEFTLPGVGKAVTDTGIRMSLSEVIRETVAKNSFLQVLGDSGQTLYFGRSRRLGSLSQYLALLGEEGGSSAPGNSTPAAMCDIHHIQSWSTGGKTDLPNLTFVDPGTHRKIDDSRTSVQNWWTLRPDESEQRTGEKTGLGHHGHCGSDRVIWVPPASVGGERVPVRNEDPGAFDNPGRWLRRKAEDRETKPKLERLEGVEGFEGFEGEDEPP